MAKMRLSQLGSEHEIVVEPHDGQTVLRVDGEERMRARSLPGYLDVGGRVIPYHACRTADGVEVWIGGQTYRFETATAARARHGPAAAAGSQITAPMPGTVRRVEVQVGDEVAERQAVVILESMKMELTLHAPRAGMVERVSCVAGQLVDMGAVLVALQEEPEA